MSAIRTCRAIAPLLVLALVVQGGTAAAAGAADYPYAADPAIVKQIEGLREGQSLLLPPVKHFKHGLPASGVGHDGPYARDYTDKMVYAPERQTALYEGGNHGQGRTNDVWEFHLASNAWHCLHESDGGDHARFKFALMFYPRLMAKDEHVALTDQQRQEVDDCQKWWVKNVVLRDGNFVMRDTGAPILVGHTWDTMMYDPVNKRLVHGTGAHCANLPWLAHRFEGTPLAEVEAHHGKRSDGTPWRTPWLFDPATGKWSPYANASPLATLEGMGGSLLYLPDQQKAVWYYCGENTPGAPHTMRLWDLRRDTWEEMRPNDGVGVGTLGLRLKIAPQSEQQMVYALPHKRIIAVEDRSTYGYDFSGNRWSKLNDAVPFPADDARTVFAYDSRSDVCLLADPRQNRLAVYDPKTNAWVAEEPRGPGMPKPPYCVGKGYYDPTYDVFVVQSAYTNRMWLYRYGPAPAGTPVQREK